MFRTTLTGDNTSMNNAYDAANTYGVRYSGELVGPDYHKGVDSSRTYSAREIDELGGRITRLRLLTDPGFPAYDVSYCHATLPSGDIVPVWLGESQLPRRNTLGFLIALAKRDGYNAKRIGLLDRGAWSVLY